MISGITISRRVLISSVLGVSIVLVALYINSSHNKQPVAAANETPSILVSRPNIDLDNIPLNNPPSSETAGQTLTQTDILTRNVLGPYLKQLQDGTYSPESKAKILKDATSYMMTLDFTPLTANDITISNSIDKDSVNIYKNKLQAIMQPLFDIPEYELTTYARAIRDNSKEDFDHIKGLSALYKEAGTAALSLTTPRDVSAVHLDIINNLNKFSVILTELAKGYDDPAASLSGVANFTETENNFGKAFDNLKTYFVLKGVYNTTI